VAKRRARSAADGEEHRGEAAADAEQRGGVAGGKGWGAGVDGTTGGGGFSGKGERRRQRDTADVSEKLEGAKVLRGVETETLEEQLRVAASDLVRDDAARRGGVPAGLGAKARPEFFGERDAGAEQGLGVGLHDETAGSTGGIATTGGGTGNTTAGGVAFAEGVRGGVGEGGGGEQAHGRERVRHRRRRHAVLVANHGGGGTGTDGEVREVGLDGLAVEGAVERAGVERGDGALDERAAVFAGAHERAADLPAFDEAGGEDERVQEAEAGVRHVEDLRRR